VLSVSLGLLAGLSTASDSSVNHIAYGWTALKMVGAGPPSDRLDAARRYVDMDALETDYEWNLAYKVTRLLALTVLVRDGTFSLGDAGALEKECSAVGWVDCSPERLEQMTSEFVTER
jgi:hypothetical protein